MQWECWWLFWGERACAHAQTKILKPGSNYISSWVVQLEAGRSIMGEQIDVKNANTKYYVCANHLSQKKKRHKRQENLVAVSASRSSSSYWAALSFSPLPWLRCHDWGDVADWEANVIISERQWRLSAVSCWLAFRPAVMSSVSTSHFQTA